MSPPAGADALEYCERIRDLVLHHSGGWADADALRTFRLLSAAARRAADDAVCEEIMHSADQYAADLFSAGAHHKWAQGKTSGVDVLRLGILGKLDALRDRLIALQGPAGPHSPGADRMLYPRDE